MITDRPAMAFYLKPTDDLWAWAARKYSIKILGSEVNWDPSPPDDPKCAAEHSVPYHGQPGRIRIADFPYDGPQGDKATAFEVLWLGAAFELHNIENAKDFESLYGKARAQTITKDEFVRSCCTLEYKAIQRTRKWYVEIFLSHLKKYDLPTNPTFWRCDWWGPADEVFALYTDKHSYPWVPYGAYYEQFIPVNH